MFISLDDVDFGYIGRRRLVDFVFDEYELAAFDIFYGVSCVIAVIHDGLRRKTKFSSMKF